MFNLVPLISSFVIIALAELGDKTQLLTFTFAVRFPLWEVIAAVSLAAGILMAVAVIFGGLINYIVAPFYVQLLAGLLFIGFGLWNLIGKSEEEIEDRDKKGGKPFWIVFFAFIIAELGDKTQLTTFALSAKYGTPFMVWLGATLGMIVINFGGAFLGKSIGKYIPEKQVRIIGAIIFIIFGLVTLGELFFWQQTNT